MTAELKVALKLDRISVSYQRNKVLDELSLDIRENEIVCLLGQSGSGKTTVLKSIAGLLPLQHGDINLNGVSLSSAKHCVVPEQRGISIIFQDFALFPHLTVLENVCFGINEKGKAATDKGQKLLETVKMADFGSVYPSQLSGGQQQRVAIARALAADPKVLLLDEPFSNVDHHLREQLMLDIRMILKQHKTPAVFVTHSKEEAFTFADRLAFMAAGKIVQQGPAESLYFQPCNASLAESMGEGNWLDVTITGDMTTQCPRLGMISTTVPHNQMLSTQMRQFVRPDQITIQANADGRAEVISQLFNGESRLYFIRLEGVELRVSAASHENYEPGTKVDIHVIPHQAILFE